MLETELKLHVPAASRAAVLKAVSTATAQTTALQARYVDTPEQALARAGLAWRLRREGRRWVQTLKGRGDGLMARPEHEVAVRAPGPDTLPDPARHDGTPVGALLRQALGGTGLAALQCVYRTDIRRVHRTVRQGGAVVELAFDEGWLVAGPPAALRRLPVCELELELKSGPPSVLFDLAERWSQRHGLWLDVRTKSERGHRLALEAPAPVARASAQTALPPEAPAAWRAMLTDCLGHLLPNLSALAAGEGGPDHVHQARVALRRLRTVLRLPPDWHGQAEAAQAVEAGWREPFTRLGAQRDADVVRELLGPPLQAAGLDSAALWGAAIALQDPASANGAGAGVDDGGAALTARSPDVTLQVLRTWRLALPAHEAPVDAEAVEAPDAPEALQPLARPWLERRWRQLRREARGFSALSLQDQHRLRKRLKRLRYTLELLSPAAAEAPEAARALRRLLEALGAWNDRAVAREVLGRAAGEAGATSSATLLAGEHARAWAQGWLTGGEPAVLRAVEQAVEAFRAYRSPWGRAGRRGKDPKVAKDEKGVKPKRKPRPPKREA